MGTIKARKNREGKTTYHAEVRRRGSPALYQSFFRLTDARAWIHDTESDIRNGRNLPGHEAQRHTLAEAIERYLIEVPCDNKRVLADKRRQLGWFRERIGNRLLAEVTSALLSELRGQFLQGITRFKEPRRPQTWNRYLSSHWCPN